MHAHQDGLIKPFAIDRKGFVFGDGGTGIVLEDLHSALERKAPIYAEYLGGGFCLESWKVTIPNLISDFYTNTILEALQKAKIKRNEIDLLIPHGVGTTVADAHEAKAITNVFGYFPNKPLITAFKPYVGHTLGNSALLELVISILAFWSIPRLLIPSSFLAPNKISA